jgi:CHAT domain-containing protein
MRRPRILLLYAALTMPGAATAAAFELPASCNTVSSRVDEKTSIRELRKRVEAANETDPAAAFGMLCTTIPRVSREYGAESPEMAWWSASLATPLIAYMDKFDEALPVLEFARPILERRYGHYGEPLGDIHVAYAWVYFRQGRLAESAAAWSEALQVRERFPGKKQIELQKVLVGLAQAQLAQHDFAPAQKNLERAHAILVANHDTVSEAGAAIESAFINVAIRQERFADARSHAEETLRIERQLKDGAAQLVPAYALLGRILERLNEYDQAEQSLRRAVELAEGAQGPLQRHRFSALYQLAALLDERDRAAEARDAAARALTVGESTLGAQAPRLVPVLQVLGDAEQQLGQLPEALRRFERAGAIIAIDRGNVERSWLVDYYRELGVLQMSLGDVPEAERTLASGLAAAADDPNLAVERARTMLEHSRAGRELGQAGREELLQAQVLLRSKLPESHPSILRVLNQLCELEIATPASTPNCEASATRLAQAPDTEPGLRAAIYGNQSRLAQARADSDSARKFAVRAVAAAENTGTPEPLWRAYFQLASVLRAGQETSLAVFFGKQALEQIEGERSHFVGADQHFDRAFLRDKVAVYRSVADWLLELGRIDEGLAVLRLMKTEELTNFGVRDAQLATAHSLEFNPQELDLQGRYSQAVQADLTSSGELSRLGRLDEANHISPTEREQLGRLLAGKGETEDARATRIEQLLGGSIAQVGVQQTQPRAVAAAALASAAQSFGPDTAFAVYLLAETHLRVLVTARGAQERFLIPIDNAQLQRDIGHFLDDIAQQRDVTALSARLYDTIARRVDEFAAQHHVHRLTLWLDGSLRYVPIAALQDGRQYLADKYVIQIYSPAPASVGSGQASRSPRAVVRGFGVTQAVAGYPALPAVADELCYVVHGPIEGLHATNEGCVTEGTGNGALNGAGFADSAFTEQRFTAALNGAHDFSVLHIGTHFRLRPGNALRSYLLLGDGSKLTLDVISALDFKDIAVVTLSACETGLGGTRTDDGREVEGLSALVQRRGAGQVIASLWQVEDASTAVLMHTLYTSFAGARDAALAMQKAQRAVRSLKGRSGVTFANPYYWAGFSVSGSHP